MFQNLLTRGTRGRGGEARSEFERDAVRFVVATGVLVLSMLIALSMPQISDQRAARRYPVTADTVMTATMQLAELPEAGPPIPPYEREKFGTAWSDVDLNGCDTRNDILRRDLVDVMGAPDDSSCVVQTGKLDDPYTGEVILFERGVTSRKVQIDHVVALSDAWRSGAWRWGTAARLQFANDPMNLVAVSGDANQEKGAATADEWLPPNIGYACIYVVKQVMVKHRYALGVSDSERAALATALGKCVVSK